MSSLVQGFFTDVHVSFLGYIPQCGMAGSWKYVYVELFGNAKLSSSGGVVISHCVLTCVSLKPTHIGLLFPCLLVIFSVFWGEVSVQNFAHY